MITPDYVRTMARYNTWQNTQMGEGLAALSDEALRADRGAFFGSIFETLNHLLWGDLTWLARFDGGAPPPGEGARYNTQLCDTFAAWTDLRRATDARILRWADTVTPDDLSGDLAWYSGMLRRDMSKPLALCVTHFFNHQTHHRGQIHAMMTAAGAPTGVTDLAFAPTDVI